MLTSFTASTLQAMGDKTAARRMAQECNVPVVPGTDEALESAGERSAAQRSTQHGVAHSVVQCRLWHGISGSSKGNCLRAAYGWQSLAGLRRVRSTGRQGIVSWPDVLYRGCRGVGFPG